MTKRSERRAMLFAVDDTSSLLVEAHETLESLAEAFGEADAPTGPELHRRATQQLAYAARQIESLADEFSPFESEVAGPVALRGTMCAGILGYQLVALGMLLDGMTLTRIAEEEDEELLQEAMEAAEFTYHTHAGILDSVRAAREDALPALSSTFIDLGAEPQAAFQIYLAQVAEIKARLTSG